MEETLTQERLQSALHYDPETGVFTWKIRPSQRTRAGQIAGSKTRNGYVEIGLFGIRYYAHRLAWLYIHGAFPEHDIDHRNGDGTDNRADNLRHCVHAENHQNKAKHKNNTSGFIGVSWEKRKHKWQAGIKIGYKRKFLGYFDTPEQAHAAYCEAKKEIHSFQPTPR